MANDSRVKDDCKVYFELQEAQLLETDADGDVPPAIDQSKSGQLEPQEYSFLEKSVQSIVTSFLDRSFRQRDDDNEGHYEVVIGAYDLAIAWAQMKSLPNANQARTNYDSYEKSLQSANSSAPDPASNAPDPASNIKMSRGSKSVDCASLGGPYAAAFSRFNYTCIQIEGDEKETTILLERITNAKGGPRSYYVVQRKVKGKYRYEVAKANEIKVALEDWQAEPRKWIVDETKRGKFQPKQAGVFKEYWFAAYMTPPARRVGTTPRSPTTLSVVVSDKGPQILIFGDLTSWIGQEKAVSEVEKSCQSQGVPPLWLVKSQTVIVDDPRCHNPIQTRRKREVTTLPGGSTGSPELQSINQNSLIRSTINEAIKNMLEPVIAGQDKFQKELLGMMARIEKLEDRLPGAPTIDLSNQTT